MSGGSMRYRHEELRQVLADHDTLFGDLGSDGHPSAGRKSARAYLRCLHQQLLAMADLLQVIELEDSGDCGPERMQAALEKFQAEAAKLEWLP